MKPSISIIIRCFNEEKHINKLLSGIKRQTRQDYEIILVDSGSTDATVSIASNYDVRLVSIDPEDFSFGRSLNLGCQEAHGEFLVIVSAHVYPIYEDWLERLLEPFSNSSVGLTYGRQRGNETTKYSEHQVFAKWFPAQSDLNQSHPFCNNANAAVRRSLWEKVTYDELLTGLEDLHWAKQVMQLGCRVSYVSEAEIVHVHDETPQHIRNRYRREAISFKSIFPQEQFSFWNFIRLTTTNIISDYYHAMLDGVLSENLFSIPIFRSMQFWGTYQGFHQAGLIPKQLRQTFYYPRQIILSKNTYTLFNSKTAIERQAINYDDQQKEDLVGGKIH
jgi:rhamnosyltransferase